MKFNLPKFNFKSSDIIKIDTLIGKRSVINGDVTGKGNYKIDGTVNGDVLIKGDLVTGEKSVITGDIVAKNIIIAGTVTGNVEASGQLTIKHTKCSSLEVLDCLFSPLFFCGIEKLVIIFLYNLSRCAVFCRIPVISVFVNSIFQ